MTKKELNELVASLSTGINPKDLQKLAAIYKSGALGLDPMDYQKILGKVFSGNGVYAKAFGNIAKGIAQGVPDLESKGIEDYQKLLEKYITPSNMRALAKKTGVPSEAVELAGLLGNSGYIKQTLAGVQNPETAVVLASRVGAKLSKDPTIQRLLGNAGGSIKKSQSIIASMAAGHYMEAWKSLDTLVLSNLDPNQKAAKDFAVTSGFARVAVTGVGDIAKAIQTSKPTLSDACGTTVACVQSAQRIINSACQLASQFGGDQSTINDVVQWTNIAAGCVTSIASGAAAGGPAGMAGAAVGAAMCALDVITAITDKPDYAKESGKQPRAIFVPHKKQMKVIATDADRLAQILRYHFNIKSYKEVYDRLIKFDPWMNTLSISHAKYPRSEGSGKSNLPGLTMLHILVALDIRASERMTGENIASSPEVEHSAARGLAKFITDTCASGKSKKGTNPTDHDNPMNLAYLQGDISAHMIQCAASVVKSYFKSEARGSSATHHTLIDPISVSKFAGFEFRQCILYANSLIELFMAMTLYDLKHNHDDIKVFLTGNLGIGQGLPVRLFTVGTAHRNYVLDEDFNEDNPDLASSDRSSEFCWTNFHRGPVGTGQCQYLEKYLIKDPKNPTRLQPDYFAVREMAFIRLLSAFSYLQYYYVRAPGGSTETRKISKVAVSSTRSVFTRPDPIADLAIKETDPLAPFATPVNPRYRIENGKIKDPTYSDLFREIEARRAVDYAVKKAVMAAIAEDRKKHTCVRLADSLKIDRSIVGSMIQLAGPSGAFKHLTHIDCVTDPTTGQQKCISAITTLARVAKACEAASVTYQGKKYPGVVGVATDGSVQCCPSLYLAQNRALCGKNKMPCHAGCTDIYKYIGGEATLAPALQPPTTVVGQQAQVEKGRFVGPDGRPLKITHSFALSGTGTQDLSNISGLRFMSWQEYQKKLLLDPTKLQQAKKAAEKDAATAKGQTNPLVIGGLIVGIGALGWVLYNRSGK